MADRLPIIRVRVGWFFPETHPNARVSWGVRAKATKAYRAEVAYCARELKPDAPWPAATVWPTFYAPNNRERDGDNCNAAIKAAIDGLADAGIVENDSTIRLDAPRLDLDPEKRGFVELLIARRESRDNRQLMPLDVAAQLLGATDAETVRAHADAADLCVDVEALDRIASAIEGGCDE